MVTPVGPSSSPCTVPRAVFSHQPCSPSRCASACVYMRKKTWGTGGAKTPRNGRGGRTAHAQAKDLYSQLVEEVRRQYGAPERVKDGVFGAKMDMALLNDVVDLCSGQQRPRCVVQVL
ncbi:hypothetical protein CHLRE_12g541851v5 [Chlamydomonas reinhardtii]|uniref:D-aminoacyl-tRNA deacylase n=1 Tax=Chlamydomonas reinhardtii TaxID=3055 RepID=A0A2K3D6U8_CHLRE|nr:uncharacterized protein CHLRE_12g541851v5 [Chlamydomonas reinhardtii]PNW76256.1 hypothetical protein CHLRE_12g541851v5 [Chlamydomonas reinhardtii]